uniref:Protein quiver n=2 Tax=Tetranychus urticae TaxID=32264 RepID=T1KV14_TETUR
MSVMSDAGKNVIDTQPVSCSICNSISKEGLTEQEIRRMGAAGQECITNPKKFVKSCDQWRADHSDHPLNKSIRYTGCYKTVFTLDYDIDGNKEPEERVVRSCGFLGTPGCFNAPGHGTTQKICFCTGPECNGSSSLIPSFISIVSLIVSLILLRL